MANDSDSSEFQDEFDDDLFKGKEDREWMMTLKELEVFLLVSFDYDKADSWRSNFCCAARSYYY